MNTLSGKTKLNKAQYLRLLIGMRQNEAAEFFGVSRRTWQNWEVDDNAPDWISRYIELWRRLEKCAVEGEKVKNGFGNE